MMTQERIDDVFAALVRLRGPSERQRVLVTGVYRDDATVGRAVDELRASQHDVSFRLGAMGAASARLEALTVAEHQQRGKFQNINELLEGASGYDWLLIVDDDVELPAGFLDTFLRVCRACDFDLAQPAQTRYSNANWATAKRKLLSVARSTRFVEIGPVTAISARAAEVLLPFPADLRYGWGLDFHWAHLMEQAGCEMGVVDMTPVRHVSRRVASTYSWDLAQEEGRSFLAQVPHLSVAEAARTVRTYRRVPAEHSRARRGRP